MENAPRHAGIGYLVQLGLHPLMAHLSDPWVGRWYMTSWVEHRPRRCTWDVSAIYMYDRNVVIDAADVRLNGAFDE